MASRFVQRAPTRDPAIFYRIHISPIHKSHLIWWNTYVQPRIDRLPNRADQGWRWTRIRMLCHSAGIAQDVRDFAITTTPPDGSPTIVLGLVVVATKYPFLADPRQLSVFLWHCSTIPQQVLTDYIPEPWPKQLGQIAVDLAVTVGFRQGWQGRTGTHADPKGGPALLQFYHQTCQMHPLPAHRSLPTLGRRLFQTNDGRYCYLDPIRALSFSQSLTHLRKKE